MVSCADPTPLLSDVSRFMISVILWLQEVPIAVDSSFLLFTLNEYLSRTALLVQPLHLGSDMEDKDLQYVDIPLPLPAADEARIGGIASTR